MMEIEKKGIVFNIQRFSVDDGDGIRTTVFLKGCPLRCAWCHNPESWSAHATVSYIAESCIGCGACTGVCERGLHKTESGEHSFSRGDCIGCGACAEVCPTAALEDCGREYTVSELMSVLRRDMPFYKNGGGITLSGGEPMMQADFVLELARVAKGEGISVMIETSGFGKKSDFERIAPFCDAFLFDCKASAARHLELVGVSDDVILDNLGYLDSVGARIIIRAPIVPGANLDSEFVEKLRSLKRKYASVEKIELLPYHKIGLSKNKRLGLCDQTEFAVPTPELIDQIYAELEK